MASRTEERGNLHCLQMNGRLSSLLLPSQHFSSTSNQRQKFLRRKKETLWSRVLLCIIPEHKGAPLSQEGLLGTGSVSQTVIIKIIYSIIFVSRDFPCLSLPLELASVEMKTMASSWLLEKQKKRKDFCCCCCYWKRYQRNEKECLYSHRPLCSCKCLKGKTRAWRIHRDVKSRLSFSLSSVQRQSTSQNICVNECLHVQVKAREIRRCREIEKERGRKWMATREELERGKRDLFSHNKFCHNWYKYFTYSTFVEKWY